MEQENGWLRFVLAAHNIAAWRWTVGAVICVIVITVVGIYAWQVGIHPNDLAALGYPGVFLIMLISGGGVFLPAAGHATVLAAGSLWNPFLVGLTAGLGNATGEITGYAVGRAGLVALKGDKYSRWWALSARWLGRYGFFAIMVMALIPNPVFDVIGVLAGSLAYPIRRFWLACAVGNSAKYIGLAYLGEAAKWWLG